MTDHVKSVLIVAGVSIVMLAIAVVLVNTYWGGDQ